MGSGMRRWVVIIAGIAALAARPVAAELRTWSDRTGKYKIEAEFVEIRDGKLRLKDKDGKTISLPLSKVSEDDRAYIRGLQQGGNAGGAPDGGGDSDNPFAGGPAEPGGASADEVNAAFAEAAARARGFAGRRTIGPRGITAGGPTKELKDYKVGDKVEVQNREGRWVAAAVSGFEKTFGHVFVSVAGTDEMIEVYAEHDIRPFDPNRVINPAPLSEVNLANIPRIIPLGGATGTFTPDPAPTQVQSWTPRPVALAQSAGFFESVLGVSFASSGEKAAVGHSGGAGVRDDSSRIEICDLKTGIISAVLPGPAGMKLFAISPAGNRVLTISEEDHFHTGPVQLWELGEKGLKPLKSWIAAQESRMGHANIEWLGWTDEQHAMTQDDNGLTMWDVDVPQGVYQITGKRMGPPAFSPGGKQFAIGTENGFEVHDVASGQLLSRIATNKPSLNRQVAFSPTGKLLAVTGLSTVEIYDVTTGQKLTEAYSEGSARGGLIWTDEENVLVGGTSLIHLPSQMTVWTYRHTAESVVPLAGRIWYVMGGRANEQAALLPFQLPHGAVTPVSDGELALKPGDQVSLEIEGIFNMQQAEGSTPPEDQLKQALSDAGFVLVDGSSKKLVGRALYGETKEVTYTDRMRPVTGESQKVSVTQRIYEIELFVDGQSVWKRSRVIDAPHMLSLGENESIDQAIDRVMAADTGFFRTTVPSRLLPTALEQRAARRYRLTASSSAIGEAAHGLPFTWRSIRLGSRPK